MREMTNFLENVISGNKERTFVSIDQQRKVRIPLLIPKKTDKNVTRYSTNIHEISGYPNLKANPNRVQLQNITQAAILYATYTTLGDNHQDLLHVNKTLNAYMRGGDINGVRVKRYSKEAEQLVNNAWGDVFKNVAPELNESINSTAKKLIDTTLNELAENGELEAAQVKIDKAKRASKLFLTAFNTNLLHSKDTPLTTATAISEVYSSLPEKIEKFYKERYQSAHPKDYLYTLMTNHTSDIQDICDAANINFDQIKNYITFIGVNQQSGEDTAIASADYKKARVNNKKNVRGKINAYIKEDQQWNGVYHLLINVTHYEGQANLSNSIMLYSHNELATDSHSPNLLAPFLREESKVRPLIDENRALQLAEEQIKNQINQAESIERLKQENKEKREVSISEFLNLQLVETVDQLQGTYFDQKGISELVIKHMPNMRIDDEKNVWLPLVNVAEQDAEIDNVEGFQKYLPQKSELSGTNKLFEGVGEGRKNQACAVIGDIESASIIIESEGVANGLLAVEMAQQQGIEVAAVCGLDVGNLPHTTGKIIASHPTKPVINLADNDLFNSDKEQRYLLHEIAALNLPDNQKTRNVGMVRAIEMTNTINLPHITFDFENDFSQNLIDYQRDRKGSDIDDALNFLYEKNATLGIPSPADAAWNEVSQVLADKITLAMQYNVSPHWTVEQQHNFAWCASTENLNTKALNDYYHLKEVIDRSHDVFLENHNLPYEVYRSAIRTKHAPMIEQEIEVDENLTQVFEQAIDEHLDLESSIEQIEENNPIQHRSEPIPALDNELPHLMSPTIIESTIYVDTKINSITRKLDNIEKSLTKMPGYEYQKRLVKNMAVLHRLVDEKSRLLGVSSQQIQQTSELALYFDREAELTSAIEMTNMQVDFVPSEEDWTELDAAEKLRTASRDEHLYDFQVDTGSEEEPSATLTQRTPEELLNEILKDIPDEPRSDIDGSQKVIGPEQTADAEQPEGAQPESSIQTTHEGDSEPTVAESTVDQNVTESELTTDVEQPEGAQPESLIQTTHEGDSEPTVAESTVDQNVTESEQTTDVDQPEGAQFESSIQTTHEGDSEPTVAESTVDQNVTESEQTTDVEQPEGAQFESSIQTTHEGDSEPTAAESTVDQNVTESEQTTDVDQPEGAQFESSIQTTHEGDREPTVAESTVDQNVTESQSSAPQVAEAITSPKADENQRIHNPSEYEQLIRNNTADRLWQSFLEPNQNEEIDSIFRTSNFEPQSLELGELDIEFDSLEDQNLFESNTNNNLHSETGDVHDFTSKANSAPKNDSSRETSMFEKAFQAIALQNQKTIEAITSLVETVITQQSAIFEKQNVMFEKIMHNQQEMMQQVLKQQTQIFGSIEQLSHRIGLVSGEHVLGVSDPLQQPSTEIEQWAELLAEYKSNQVEIAEKKNTIAQIDKLIDETKKHNPEELAEVMNPANVAAKTSEQQIENTYQQIIDELKTHKHEIDRGFKQLPKEVKALFGKALNKTDTLITISELKSDTYTCMAKIKNVVEDVYSAANDTYHRGLPMSIALGEVLRNSSQKNCPPSALTSVAAACITGEVKPTDKISEDVINGVITADEYYQQCQSILGDDQFSTQLGDEYQEYLQLNKQQQTNSFEQAVAPPFTDHQIDNQPSM